MEMKPVKSSTLKEVGYDAQSKTLAVTFKNGGTYHYPNVPEHEHARLLAAPSLGGHFAQHIRPVYKGKRL